MPRGSNKIYLVLLPTVIIIALVLVLANSRVQKSNVENESQTTAPTADSDQNVTETQTKTLAIIGSRCRGCGRCATTDPEHFEMNGSIATIISNTDLDSKALTSAMNRCPSDAITLL